MQTNGMPKRCRWRHGDSFQREERTAQSGKILWDADVNQLNRQSIRSGLYSDVAVITMASSDTEPIIGSEDRISALWCRHMREAEKVRWKGCMLAGLDVEVRHEPETSKQGLLHAESEVRAGKAILSDRGERSKEQ